MGSKKAPAYPTTTVSSGGLFGSSTTNASGTTFDPTDFQKRFVGISEQGALNSLNEYLNPNYDSEAFHQADDYYTNKMTNLLNNNYLNGALSRGLLRGSTASDAMRGLATDLANTEYERQRDYKDQQLQNLQAALLGYNNIYDIYKGASGLSQNLANSIADYNMKKYQVDNSGSSGLGTALGAIGSIGSLAGGAGALAGGAAKLGSLFVK